MDEQNRPILPAKRCVKMLLAGLLPVAGIIPDILWAYGPDVHPQQRALAKAMLCVHAVGLCLLLVGLGVWVLALLARLA